MSKRKLKKEEEEEMRSVFICEALGSYLQAKEDVANY